MKLLITGAAGFIGSFLCKCLLETTNDEIIGLDNLNDYYDVSLKETRLDMLKPYKNFKFIKGDVPVTYADTSDLERDFGYKPATGLRDGLRSFVEWYRTILYNGTFTQ